VLERIYVHLSPLKFCHFYQAGMIGKQFYVTYDEMAVNINRKLY